MKSLLGKAHDPSFWRTVREDELYRPLVDDVLSLWEREGTADIPSLSYSAYRRFVFDGDRETYEAPYFQRRRVLSVSAILSLIYPERQEYLVRLMDVIYAICDEYTWCLPAHQTELGVNNNRHIDLFAAETSMALAEIYTLLGDRMEPLIGDRIRVEIDRRIVDSYRETRFLWEKTPINWAAVCACSVGCTLMLMRPELYVEWKERLMATKQCYLSGLTSDGICEEGVGYWSYGFGFFTVWADMHRTFTDGSEDWFAEDKVKTAAPFLGRMFLSGRAIASFSDCNRVGSYDLAVLHYLKHEYPQTVTVPLATYGGILNETGCWCTLLRGFTWLSAAHMTSSTEEEMLYFAPETGWLMMRNQRYGFAAKGGRNMEPHNHNDVGSFVLAAQGHQILADPGRGVYTRQYFAESTRYAQVACGSHGHSVPFFGTDADRSEKGELYGYQKFGKTFRAEGVRFDGQALSMDIASAYGDPAVRRVLRSLTLTEDGVILRDEFDVAEELPVTERLVSMYPFVLGEGCATTDLVTLTFDPASYEVTTSVGDFCPDCPVYFLDLRLKSGVTTAEIIARVQKCEE